MAGLWPDDAEERRQNIGLLALLAGGNMLAANGPGVTTGQAIGSGLAAGAQGMQQMQVNQMRRQQLAQQAQLQQAQIEQMQFRAAQEKARAEALQRIFASGQPDANPNEVSRATGGAQPSMADIAAVDPGAAIRSMLGTDTPASLREWQAYQAMSPDDQQKYLGMKRQQQWLNLGGTYAAPSMVSPSAPPVGSMPVTLKPGETPEVRGEQSRAEAVGKAGGEAQARLPDATAVADSLIASVNAVSEHPAMKNVVGVPGSISGASSRVFGTGLPGSEESDFMAKLRQLQGKQFLQAFETLKGGGQITQIEGEKATAALARMLELNVSPEDYKKAADEFKAELRKGISKARMKAGGGQPAPQAQPVQPAQPAQQDDDALVRKYLGR